MMKRGNWWIFLLAILALPFLGWVAILNPPEFECVVSYERVSNYVGNETLIFERELTRNDPHVCRIDLAADSVAYKVHHEFQHRYSELGPVETELGSSDLLVEAYIDFRMEKSPLLPYPRTVEFSFFPQMEWKAMIDAQEHGKYPLSARSRFYKSGHVRVSWLCPQYKIKKYILEQEMPKMKAFSTKQIADLMAPYGVRVEQAIATEQEELPLQQPESVGRIYPN